jgi:predicted nucleotidyltransferase component of viral defense system
MKPRDYNKQANLLLSVLPLVATESNFALHGGTAINMFHSNMPRLSVDADLTYLPVETRANSLAGINGALQRIAHKVEATLPETFVEHRQADARLIISNREAGIKVEVNTIKRGCYSPPEMMVLCDQAQKEFDAFCEMQVVDKQFLLKFKQGTPDWSLHDFSIFPAVQWKLLNIQHLKTQNPAKHKEMWNGLKDRLAL